ncbi:UDP-N-acetylmuramoyl-L-alanine--D-glutamate ligase [Acidiferrimicrobium sp. IK]|uniref:UDP-N-acetylmuramoyl-L-alanine--D-glutamate ligase n=1 Tax=Acidiferrimicrobium sp. IK TaxID=2871700 RepID=UPI0021CB8DCA|nr:UDP-N-acetylmuramoyl-L-alanine--D-glutamate ligase [Acidiferrimicrobium sp. IK]MCU4183688.1 UDP-N-acetylmuramoyl-L-alanine--D-glutamate ligase [Acidiferrimicrobium sp. IK]
MVVVGFGVTGQSVAALLLGAGDSVTVVDDRPSDAARAAADALGLSIVSSPAEDELAGVVTGAAMVVPSPGVPAGHPVFALAAAAGVPVRSEIELAWARLQARPAPRPILVAITGTNGKTTVTTLATAILAASGLRAVAGGNIGVPLVDAVDADVDVVVAEVSSFQLQHTEGWHPAVSCWLNLSEDHLDWHPDMAHYAAAKARIWRRQGPGDTAVINADDPAVMAAAEEIPAGVERVTFGAADGAMWRDLGPDRDGRAVLRDPGGRDLLDGGRLPRALPHDRSNALAAAAVATAAGATAAGVAAGLTGAALLPHRVELVAERDGIRWYDDSKATTPASVLAATAGMESVVLIAGGRNKGLDLTPLRATVPPVHAVVAIGEAAAEVADALAGVADVRVADDMASAVTTAAALAHPGDAVVLSPGCASFDWYTSYAARGDDFAGRVRAHLGMTAEAEGRPAGAPPASTPGGPIPETDLTLAADPIPMEEPR